MPVHNLMSFVDTFGPMPNDLYDSRKRQYAIRMFNEVITERYGIEHNGVYYKLNEADRTAHVTMVLSPKTVVVEPSIEHEGISYQVVSIANNVLKIADFIIKCRVTSPLVELAFEGYNVQIV